MTETMNAVGLSEFGDSAVLKLITFPQPTARDGEVLIAVKACGINPIDYKTRLGQGVNRGWPDDLEKPIVIGWDISGEVVGSNAPAFKPGDSVYTMARFPQPGMGYAEFSAVPAEELAAKPSTLDHTTAAAVPLVALTAWQALIEWADIQAGQRVLVHAAAGGVGHIAVQIAKWKGCEVLGTASGHNQEFLEGLGVDQVIDYTQQDFATAAQDVDVVFHTLPADLRPKSWQTLKPGGKLVSITGPIAEGEAEEHSCTGNFIMVRPSGEQLAKIGNLIDAGTLKPIVDRVFPLAETAAAHDYVEAGHTRGKVVVEV